MLKKEDGLLDFTRPAETLARQVRAYNPWPGTYFEWKGKTLKVHHAGHSPGNTRTGVRGLIDDQPAVGTSDGWLVLEEVQLAGKRAMGGKAFLAGARDW
jgi:methionyl-tRNA formyltransferase